MKRSTMALLMSGTTAILSTLALATHPAVAAAPSEELYSPPAAGEQLILTRELHKPLYDGNEVFTTRSYAIRFSKTEDGYRVDGRLVSVDVKTPASLEPLAAIERQRPDEGVFPIWLDASGAVVRENAPGKSTTLTQASKVVDRWLDNSSLTDSERQMVNSFVTQLKNAGPAAGSAFPRDLFNPSTGSRAETQTVDLPNGRQGKITIEVDASADRSAGLVGRIERRVTTDMGGEQRMTREVWSLAEARN